MVAWAQIDSTDGRGWEDDTSATNEVHSVSSNGYVTVITYRKNSSNTESEYDRRMREKWEDEEFWRIEIERREFREEVRELNAINRRIKRKVNIPILPQNVINKTMQRRMMNGRR